MGKFWARRWTEKAARLRDVGENFRADQQLMHGIQAPFDRRSALRWLTLCREAGVAWQYWGDSPVGGPQVINLDGQLVTPGSLRHAYTAHRIRERLPIHDKLGRVVEIGGGYGGFARAMHQRFKIGHYILVDDPSCLKIQNRFLRDAVLDGVFSYATMATLDRFDDFDLVINHNSFAEMDPPEVATYLGLIQDRTKQGGAIHIVNRIQRQTPLSEYPFDDRWEMDMTNWVKDPAWFELWAWRTKKGRGEPAPDIARIG